jgi:hypothetical protein
MKREPQKSKPTGKICPVCRGTGLDKSAHRRYTTGGHDDRSCLRCGGECYIDDDTERVPKIR